MNRLAANKARSAFTLIEILVAAVVFSLFLGGLFSLYRMGSRMYFAGGWKLQRQKDAEKFLNAVKERVEQGSNPVEVAANGTLIEGIGRFVMVNPATYSYRTGIGNTLTDTKLLAAFPLCKPSIRGEKGLILYNLLRARRNREGNNLMMLEFLSTPAINTGMGQDFITGSIFNFFDVNPDVAKFDGLPSNFGIGQTHLTLTDLLSIQISVPPIPAAFVASDSLIRIDLVFEHPKFPDTRVEHSMTSSVEISLNPGGL